MKKTLLATVLGAAFASVAQAGSSVTLYGLIDMGLAYEQQKTNHRVVDTVGGDIVYGAISGKRTKFGVRNAGRSGSRWGIRGVEDLGNGLRAVFQLEHGFEATTGYGRQSGRMFGRTATLGLASNDWGQIDVGRQVNVASRYVRSVADPFSGNFGQVRMGAAFGAAATVRYDNMILYQTPDVSGFKFGIGYSFNAGGEQEWTDSDSDNPNTRAFTTGFSYTSGPLAFALSYDQKTNRSNSGYADTTVSQWSLGAAYDFDVVTVSGAFGQTRNGRFGPVYGWNGGAAFSPGLQAVYDSLDPTNPADQVTRGDMDDMLASATLGLNEFDRGFRSNSFLIGFSAPVGAGTFMASWHMADPRSNPDRMRSDDWGMKKQHTYNLGYIYPLSVRTSLYAYGSHAKNHAFIDGSDTTIVGAGLRHEF